MPQPLAREAVSGADPSHAVVAGGLVSGDTSVRATYRLDLRTGHTTRLPDLPTAVHDTAGSLASGHALVIGGGNATEQSVVQARRAHGWRVIGHLPSPRSDLAAASSHGITYLVGGYDGTAPAMADVLRSRNGRRWTTVAELPVPVRYAATVLMGTSLWVFGGEVSGAMVKAVQRIDLRTGRARVAGQLPMRLGHSIAVRLGNRVLLAGGRTTSGKITSRMWWFRPDTARFTAAGRLPTPLADSAAVGGGSTAFLVGGERPAFSDRVLRLHWG
jgi:N-acetylneuraminic acid mutarotase